METKVNAKGYILFELKPWQTITLMVTSPGTINHATMVSLGKLHSGHDLMCCLALKTSKQNNGATPPTKVMCSGKPSPTWSGGNGYHRNLLQSSPGFGEAKFGMEQNKVWMSETFQGNIDRKSLWIPPQKSGLTENQ
jgi:hypothetical protein